jgi:hypothetical protein
MTQISVKQIKQQQLVNFINDVIGVSLGEGQVKDIVDQLNGIITAEVSRLDNKIDEGIENLEKKIEVSDLIRFNVSIGHTTRVLIPPDDINWNKAIFIVLNGMILKEGDNKDYTVNYDIPREILFNFDIKTTDNLEVHYYKKAE